MRNPFEPRHAFMQQQMQSPGKEIPRDVEAIRVLTLEQFHQLPDDTLLTNAIGDTKPKSKIQAWALDTKPFGMFRRAHYLEWGFKVGDPAMPAEMRLDRNPSITLPVVNGTSHVRDEGYTVPDLAVRQQAIKEYLEADRSNQGEIRAATNSGEAKMNDQGTDPSTEEGRQEAKEAYANLLESADSVTEEGIRQARGLLQGKDGEPSEDRTP
jgi:hypothetical protein